MVIYLQGEGRYEGDHLECIENVASIRLIDTSSAGPKAGFRERLEELSELSPGWLDGDGKSIPADCIAWVGSALSKMVTDWGVPAPYLFPTPEGSIEAEWNGGAWQLSARFDASDASIELLATHAESGAVNSERYTDNDANWEARTADFVLRHLPRKAVC